MRAALIALALATAYAAGAQRPDKFWYQYLSGDDFVAALDESTADKWHQTAEAASRRRFAQGYQAGVVDATQGKSWCAPPRMKPDEVDDRIWQKLVSQRGTMSGSAARVLVELYAARFPCQPHP